MTQTFTIEGRLACLNDIIGRTNYCRWAGADLKRKETKRCAQAIVAAGLKPYKTPVAILFTWVEPNNRRDPDNVRTGAKFILDALVECQILPTDGRKWVKGLVDDFPPSDKENARVDVKIVDLKGV